MPIIYSKDTLKKETDRTIFKLVRDLLFVPLCFIIPRRNQWL